MLLNMSSIPKISIIQTVAETYLRGIEENDGSFDPSYIDDLEYAIEMKQTLWKNSADKQKQLNAVYEIIYNYQQTRAPGTLGALVKIYTSYNYFKSTAPTVDPQNERANASSTPKKPQNINNDLSGSPAVNMKSQRRRSLPDLGSSPNFQFSSGDNVNNNNTLFTSTSTGTRENINMVNFSFQDASRLNSTRSDNSRKSYVPTLIFLQAEAMYAFIRGTQKYESLIRETTLCGIYFALLDGKEVKEDEECNNMLTYVNALVEQLCMFYRRLFPCFASSHDTVTSQSLENLLDATHRAMRTFNNAWSASAKFSSGIRDNPYKKMKQARNYRVEEALKASSYMYYDVYKRWKKDADNQQNEWHGNTYRYVENYLDFIGHLFSDNVASIADGIEYIRSMYRGEQPKAKSVLKIITQTAGINAIFEYDKNVTLWEEDCSDTHYWGSMKLCRTYDQNFTVALMGMLAYDIQRASQNQRCSNVMRESFKLMMRMVSAVLDGIPYDVCETFKLFTPVEDANTSLNDTRDDEDARSRAAETQKALQLAKKKK